MDQAWRPLQQVPIGSEEGSGNLSLRITQCLYQVPIGSEEGRGNLSLRITQCFIFVL